MPKQTFKCGYCKAEVKKGAKKCPKCGKEFGKKLYTVQPFAVTSGIIAAIMILFLGYIISLGRWPIQNLLIVLLIGILIPVFWKKKRKIILQRDIVIIPALLIGFILGMSGLKIPNKESFVVYFIFLAIIYAGYLGVVSLQQTAKCKIHNTSLKIMGYIGGMLIYIPSGVLMLWANLKYYFRTNSFMLFPSIFSLSLIILGFFSVYYASKIPK